MSNQIVGYARTSTVEQIAGFEAQIAELKRAGCKKIFQEQVSSVDVVARDELEQALAYVREGDVFVVTKLDRLARNIKHLLEIADKLKVKGVALRILDLNIDTGGAMGELILTMIGGIAQFERRIMLERQREGIAKAKAEGKYKGRARTAMAKGKAVIDLLKSGMGPTEAAEAAGISRRSVYRIMADAEKVSHAIADQKAPAGRRAGERKPAEPARTAPVLIIPKPGEASRARVKAPSVSGRPPALPGRQ